MKKEVILSRDSISKWEFFPRFLVIRSSGLLPIFHGCLRTNCQLQFQDGRAKNFFSCQAPFRPILHSLLQASMSQNHSKLSNKTPLFFFKPIRTETGMCKICFSPNNQSFGVSAGTAGTAKASGTLDSGCSTDYIGVGIILWKKSNHSNFKL